MKKLKGNSYAFYERKVQQFMVKKALLETWHERGDPDPVYVRELEKRLRRLKAVVAL